MFDDIINLVYLLPKKYDLSAKFFVHRNNIRELRKVKDTNGRYIWQEPLSVGQPATIYGFPVVEDNNLPESEIYFGDMKYAYYLGDRQQMSVKISQDTETALNGKCSINRMNCWEALKRGLSATKCQFKRLVKAQSIGLETAFGGI